MEEAADVDAAIARLQAAGYPIDVERAETCCYAIQNKVWATDPDGRRWETYYIIAETQERDNVLHHEVGDGRRIAGVLLT